MYLYKYVYIYVYIYICWNAVVGYACEMASSKISQPELTRHVILRILQLISLDQN